MDNIRLTITIDYGTLERLLELARRDGISLGTVSSQILKLYCIEHDDGLRPGREGGK